MKREKEFVKNSFILSIGTFFPKLASLIILPIITGCLNKADYGTYDLIVILATLFLPVATLQMQAAAFRFLVDVRDDPKQQNVVITNIILFTIPISLVSLIILYFVMGNLSVILRLHILSYYFIDTLLITARQIARGLAKNSVYSISVIISSFFEMSCIVLFLYFWKGSLEDAILAMSLSQIIALIYIIIRIKLYSYIELKTFSFKRIKEMIAYSWAMIPNSLSSWVMNVSDRLILTWFLGIEASATYAVSNKLPNMFNMVQNTFSLAWQENAAVSVKDKDSGKYYGKMFDNVFNIFAGVLGMLIAFTPILYKILIRGDYSDSYVHIPILYIAVLYSAVSAYIGGIYVAHKKSKEIGITTTLAAAANFIINIAFVHFIGIFAASISTLVSFVGLSVYRMIDIQKIQKIKFNYLRIIILTAILCLMAFFCSLRNTGFDIANMIISVAFAAFLNFKVIKWFLGSIKSKFKKNYGDSSDKS